jgi:hypothetical protein
MTSDMINPASLSHEWVHANNNNNNQAFYSEASWGRLEMKLHKPKKTGIKQERKRRKQRAIKNKSKKERRK